MPATAIDLNQIKQDYQARAQAVKQRIIICAGTGCVANGALKVYNRLIELLQQRDLPVVVELNQHDDNHNDNTTPVHVSKSGCQGFCQMGPLVTIEPQGWLYCKVKPNDVEELVETTLVNNQPIERLLYKDPSKDQHYLTKADIPFYKRQHRIILNNCGNIDPENIDEYIADSGYASAQKVFRDMTPQQVCQAVTESGLRGRGGGGFPTGKKWELTRQQTNTKKYVICNGDEGDPGAFMDRSVMEGNPHSVIEGMMIAARAIGADQGVIYVRMEYPLAVQRLKKAVNDAENMGLLGDNIFDTSQSFRLTVMEGAGAFVCGEETALISSIEGKRGMPTSKPPFPAQKGLYGKPTVINNVETLATIPLIFQMTPEVFAKTGTQTSPGTKTFAVTGHIANTGLVEVPFGTTLREVVYNIGGGVTDQKGIPTGKPFKAVQIGGPSGGCLTEEHLDLPLDFDSLRSIGAMVGSGGLVVMNQNTCMVKVAHFFMQFTQRESCGKCVPCREGTKQMLNLLEDIMEGNATIETLELLEELAHTVQKGSLCGLGKTAPNPVLSTLRYFRDEYLAHVVHKRCPARQCRALLTPQIDPDLCKGCTLCAKKCPVNAIEGSPKQPHTINEDLCIRCGACIELCRFNAITG